MILNVAQDVRGCIMEEVTQDTYNTEAYYSRSLGGGGLRQSFLGGAAQLKRATVTHKNHVSLQPCSFYAYAPTEGRTLPLAWRNKSFRGNQRARAKHTLLHTPSRNQDISPHGKDTYKHRP